MAAYSSLTSVKSRNTLLPLQSVSPGTRTLRTKKEKKKTKPPRGEEAHPTHRHIHARTHTLTHRQTDTQKHILLYESFHEHLWKQQQSRNSERQLKTESLKNKDSQSTISLFEAKTQSRRRRSARRQEDISTKE